VLRAEGEGAPGPVLRQLPQEDGGRSQLRQVGGAGGAGGEVGRGGGAVGGVERPVQHGVQGVEVEVAASAVTRV
jgi:hypothetical protein